ncbi:MAG: FAD-dependent oxidoreductase, partial [Solirubrobacterales bacterium]|nr:FAD-dependent oxidoreductase [Solirubrobacterales bacterium]
GAFELAELERVEPQRDAWLTIAVVGAGPTGVEVAGQIAELSRRALKRNFRGFDPARVRVILFDAASTVLPTFPESLGRRAHHDLLRLGIETRLGTTVTRVDEHGLDVIGPDGSPVRIEARTKVWAAGVKASSLGTRLAEQCGAAVDPSGRVAVLPDCTLPGRPEVFVIGDLMNLDNLPGVAEVAMQSGRHAARTIVRRLRGGEETRAFRYHDLGTMATVSRFRAVASFGPVRVGGAVAWLLWLVVHLAFLTGFKNRIATLARWTIAFVGRGRPERTITEQQVFARTRGLGADRA